MNKCKKMNKKGASAIELVLGFIILIMLISFLIDVVAILSQYTAVSQIATETARVTSVQGGYQNTVPSGWPGGDNNYLKTDEMASVLRNKFSQSSIPDNYDITFKREDGATSSITKSAATPFMADYLTTYTITVTTKYNWIFIKNFLPVPPLTIRATRPAMSEWKYNYKNWPGE